MYNQQALGYRISKYRELNNLTQKQLALKCNISQSYIASLETGKGNTINIAKLGKIANALNVSIDNLWCDSLIKLSSQQNRHSLKKDVLEEISTLTNQQMIMFNKIIYACLDYKKIKEKENKNEF